MEYQNDIQTINFEQLKNGLLNIRKSASDVFVIDEKISTEMSMREQDILYLFNQYGFEKSFSKYGAGFKQSINLGTGEFSFIFDLKALKLHAKNSALERISLQEFSNKPCSSVKIFYDPINFTKEPKEKQDIEFYRNCQEPIIIVPFPIDNSFMYYVVDGHHRVTAKINSKMSYINLSKLDELATVQTLPIPFQQYLYEYIIYLNFL